MDFVGAIKTVFRNYATFNGVAGRAEYWYWYLFTVLASIVLSVFDQLTGLSVLGTLFSLGTLVPTIAVQVRRLRDAGHSWKWLIVGAVLSVLVIAEFVFIVVRAITLIPTLNLISDNADPSYVSAQLSILFSDSSLIGGLVLLAISALFAVAYSIILLIFTIQPSKSFEQGNKYVPAASYDNLA
jgi:uncharacterized membrane protein YhaH (DUF805 family)